MIYPECISKIVKSFQKIPGIGEKTAERMAFSLIDFDKETVEELSKNVLYLKDKIHKCQKCGIITDNENLCNICKDKSRNNGIICVVEDSKDVFLLEKLGNFDGEYHVLNGLISPINGVSPDDLNIKQLIDRLKDEKHDEIILALKTGIEGETTSLYIKKVLDLYDIKISKLATGIPVGAEMDYVDSLTLESAIKNRKEIS